jgi:type I restriction enzyme S subunit
MSSKTKTTAPKEEATPALVPKLRFAEFRGAEGWSEEALSDVATIVMGSSPKSECYNQSEIGLPLLQGNADIKNRLSAPRIFTSEITKECTLGDILLSVRAPVGSVAKSIHHACIGRGIAGIRADHPNSQEFVYQWLLSYESKWVDISQGGTFDAVNSDDLKGVAFAVPSPAEQQKIAECLSSVDELIAAQARKLDALKTHKKGLMQQLFPREGETQPRLRFPEFQNAGEWVEVKLKDLFATVIDNRGKTPPLSLDGYPLVEVNALGSCSINFARVSKYVDEKTYSSWFRGHVQSGDVLFSTVGAIAESSVVCDQCQPVIAQNIVGLRFKRTVSHLFGYYLLNAVQNKAKFLRITMGAVQPSLKVSQMVHLSFPIPPSIPEQQRIADCLTSLDDLIAAQTQKHEALKTHKKGLMQQLFPSPEEVEA